MKIMRSPLRSTSFTFKSSVKLLITLSVAATLSACGSIRYNGISNADTVFDIFSFTESEDQAEQSLATAEKDDQAELQRQLMLQEQQASLAEQPGTETYERLAQGAIVQENSEQSQPDVVAKAEETQAADAPQVLIKPMSAEVAEPSPSEVLTQPQTEPVLAQTNTSDVVEALKEAREVSVSETSSVEISRVSEPRSVQTQSPSQAIPESTEADIAAIEDVNRLTKENPTAAMVSDYQVLPEVSAKADLSVPNEILLLATPAEYRPEVSEYGMWKIAKGDDSLYRENCTLASATMQVSFDNYSTQIWLNVVGDDLLVNSTTNIDINRPRVGIKLDNGPLQPFTKKHFATNAVWAGDLNTALKRNKKLSVVLSGNEIGNRVQEVSVELDDLKRAYSEYTKCNATTQVGSL